MSTSTVREHDVAELADLLALVHDVGTDDGVAIPWAFLHRLRELVECDFLCFVRQDPRECRDLFCQGVSEEGGRHHDGSPDDAYAAFWHHYWSCDSSKYADVSSDYARVTKISDFYSARQWHSTGMYVDYSKPHEIEHELTMGLPDGAGRSIRLLCYRTGGSDFGERERFLLSLLRPHIGEPYRATVRRRSGPPALTERQIEILELVRDGYTNDQIGRRLVWQRSRSSSDAGSGAKPGSAPTERSRSIPGPNRRGVRGCPGPKS